MKDADEHFSNLFMNHPLPMWVFDVETLRFLEVNEAAIYHYGYAREEFLQMTIKDIRPPEEVARLVADVAQSHKGLDKAGIWRHKKKDGTLMDVEITSHELQFAGREAKLVVAHDVTERLRAERQLRESEQRYRTTLDHMLEGCQIIGSDWRYLYLNDVAAHHGRRRKEDLLGRTMMECYPDIEHTPLFAVLQQCMTERVSRRMENEFVYPDGSRRWFHLSIEPVPEGLFILSADVTKEKELSEQLKKHQENIEALVVQRTRQLEEANRELEAFSYSVSHDLRAPLRHIDGFVTLLRHHAETLLDEKGRHYVNTISAAAKHMGQLIDDLLVFSQVGRTEMVKTMVPLSRLVSEAIEALQGETEGRAITWKIHPLPSVPGDPSLLRQVFVNLLSNAIKYTRNTARACIEIASHTTDTEHTISVRDNGVGFDMSHAHKLFGVFQRLHSTREFEGTGIGLANVRRIIARHGGRTWAEGAPGKGATFFFSLPRDQPGRTS